MVAPPAGPRIGRWSEPTSSSTRPETTATSAGRAEHWSIWLCGPVRATSARRTAAPPSRAARLDRRPQKLQSPPRPPEPRGGNRRRSRRSCSIGPCGSREVRWTATRCSAASSTRSRRRARRAPAPGHRASDRPPATGAARAAAGSARRSPTPRRRPGEVRPPRVRSRAGPTPRSGCRIRAPGRVVASPARPSGRHTSWTTMTSASRITERAGGRRPRPYGARARKP